MPRTVSLVTMRASSAATERTHTFSTSFSDGARYASSVPSGQICRAALTQNICLVSIPSVYQAWKPYQRADCVLCPLALESECDVS